MYAVLTFFSLFLGLFKIDRKKITYVSLTSDKLTGDMLYIYNALRKEGKYNQNFILIKFKKSLLYDVLYFFNCIKQLFVINTSALVIINDNNYVISNFKRDGVKVLQLWHASGAIKKFGNEIHREYEIKNYDYVVTTSSQWIRIFAKSFGVQEHHVLPLGLPKIDDLFNQDTVEHLRQLMIKKYPILKDHYVVLYAPTFRGNIIDGLKYDHLDVLYLLNHLPDNYIILYRMHPLLANVNLKQHDRIMNMGDEDLNMLFSITDCLISDYSSLIFDYSILNRKIILYAPDFNDYTIERGFNIPYHQIPAPICQTPLQLLENLKNKVYNKEHIQAFNRLYFEKQDGKSIERITEFLNKLLNEE